MKNTIAYRIYDFLKQFPPFQFMAKWDLIEICESAEVQYLDKDQVLFKRNTPYNSHFYIVHQGAIKLSRPSNNTDKVVDVCDEGDLLGLRVTKEDSYRTTAIANEETIVYALPMEAFSKLTESNKVISNYLITSFASNIKDPYSLEYSGQLLNEYDRDKSQNIYNISTARFTETVIQNNPKTSIQKAAMQMQKHQIGCLVISKNNKPIGILTNRELRNVIASGEFTAATLVNDVMVSPVICGTPDINVTQAQLILLKHGISHLIITKDGSPQTDIVGILSKHDIVVSFGNSPVGLLKEIKRATRTKHLRHAWDKAMVLLKRYLDQNLPLSEILKIFGELKDALVYQTMQLSLRKMEDAPPVSFAWLALGSQGRKEQLLYTDQDNALIYANSSPENAKEVKQYFLKLANRMNKRLHKIGYDYCPADMMASNPLYCLSLSEWESQFSTWITTPTPENILLSGIFFDYTLMYGDQVLVKKLTDHISQKLENQKVLLRHMAKNALKNLPPVSFFRQFIVEHNGEHKDFFDIKHRAIAPLSDAARVLALGQGILYTKNTAERFEALAQLDTPNRELFENCSYAFKALLKFRTKRGIAQSDSGRFINLEALTKSEKLKLKRCFKPLRDVQEVLRARYQTQHI
ncbi:DUF294 nucleotidyltransferase-like domain-containing protein [uncultured Dokdonia sp.]|uniref:DUF294 nucleotidyltransferase-like domain-containing protein n=1 Tax=uncultured Dokdonia sp. TaxID=575653 RepID=UPI002633C513|nr:DUF294 nucleotidyltransferase-like domain-containing protein [uncultured Dokdonia sp.]